MNSGAVILLLGASESAGRYFLDRTEGQRVRVIAISPRNPARTWSHVTWMQHDLENAAADVCAGTLVSFGSLDHVLAQVEQTAGLGRVIALGSADTRFIMHASDRAERHRLAALAECEDALRTACRKRDIVLSLLKPALTYDESRIDGADCTAALETGLSIVPVAGRGLRAPVHADDLARLAVECVISGARSEGTWLLGGGEVLSYPEMLRRIAASRGRGIRPLRLPVRLMKLVLRLAHLIGRMRDVRPAMIERQAVDLVVDDTPAREKLSWNPRPFRP